MLVIRSIIILVLLLVSVPGAAAQSTPSPDYAVAPPQGVPGTAFSFFAKGFGIRSMVVFWATAPDGQVFGADAYRVQANGEGRADWQWVAPSNAQPGRWAMVARQLDRPEVNITISFEIVPVADTGALPPPETSAPGSTVHDVVPRIGEPGSRFAFFARGFKRQEWVGFWFNDPTGRVYSNNNEYRVRASEQGRADWVWAAPGDAATGIWQAIARGQESGVERIIFFEIRREAPETVRNDVGVVPPVAEPDDTFAFFATGFEAREQVSFWAIDPTGKTIGRDGYKVDANADGRADWFWQAPGDALPGDWQMVAFGTKSNVTKVIFFQIRNRTED